MLSDGGTVIFGNTYNPGLRMRDTDTTLAAGPRLTVRGGTLG